MVSFFALCEWQIVLVPVTDYIISSQAKFIAQIIILGGQVIGRAFAQALRQEFQSK